MMTLGIPSLNLGQPDFDQLQAARPILCELSQIDRVKLEQRWGLLAPSGEMVDPCLAAAKRLGVPRVCFYQDQRGWDASLFKPRPGLIALPQMYRQIGESDALFESFMFREWARLWSAGWDVLPVLGVHRGQYSVNPPLYHHSIADSCNGVVLFSNVAASVGINEKNVVIFAEHHADVPPEVDPYLDRLVSLTMVIGTLPSLQWPDPTSRGLAARKTILCRT